MNQNNDNQLLLNPKDPSFIGPHPLVENNEKKKTEEIPTLTEDNNEDYFYKNESFETNEEYKQEQNMHNQSKNNRQILIGILCGLVGGAISFFLLSLLVHNNILNLSSNQNVTANISSGKISSTELETYKASDMSDIIKETMPSIVAITSTAQTQIQSFWGIDIEDVESSGSGVIVAQDDEYIYIATNYHVVENTSSLLICFNDNSTANAIVRGYDQENDLAVIMINKKDITEETANNINVAAINIEEKEEVGDQVIAIGNALGYGQSATSGIISALKKSIETEDGNTNSLTQTDAAINPGNSGGALINMTGELIGINCAKYSDTDVEGMGFSIPMSVAWPIIEGIINGEYIPESETPYIGISIATINSEYSKMYGYPEGVLLQDIHYGSPAIGILQVGDIITQINGKDVKTAEELQRTVKEYVPGDEITITVQRYVTKGQYEEKTVKITLVSKNEIIIN